MGKVELTKKERKSLIGVYKRCIDVCSFEPKRYNKAFKDPNEHFKSIVASRMSRV